MCLAIPEAVLFLWENAWNGCSMWKKNQKSDCFQYKMHRFSVGALYEEKLEG